MPNTLSESQVAFYREQGYLFPFDGIEADDAGAMRADLDVVEAALRTDCHSVRFVAQTALDSPTIMMLTLEIC